MRELRTQKYIYSHKILTQNQPYIVHPIFSIDCNNSALNVHRNVHISDLELEYQSSTIGQ